MWSIQGVLSVHTDYWTFPTVILNHRSGLYINHTTLKLVVIITITV